MNKHILLVMKWLKDKDSVSQKELVKNSRDAWSDACVAHAAAHDAAANWPNDADIWVDRYFEETGENRNDYKKELEK